MIDLWYHEREQREAAIKLLNTAKGLWREQGDRRRRIANDCLALYMGSTRYDITGALNPFDALGLVDESSAYNVVQAIVDTKVNNTLRNRVRPLFVSEGGDSELREKVQAMQDVVDATFYDLGLDGELGRQACFCGYAFEAGGIEWWADTANARIVATPVWAWDYLVSPQEARFGNPQQLFNRQIISRDRLLAFLANSPAHIRNAIKEAPPASYDELVGSGSGDAGQVVDMVVVWKGWHLPSTRVDLEDPKAFGLNDDGNRVRPNHDGRHMVVIETGSDGGAVAIADNAWPHNHYPVSWFKPNPVPGSYWSRGEPEVLANSQLELNRWNRRMERLLELHARPLMIVSKQAKLNPVQISNAYANILQAEGGVQNAIFQPTLQATPPDLLRRVADIASWAREQRGMSEMAMTAKRPAGVNHEPPLAYLADTETVRHTVEFRAWEKFNLDCAKNIIRCVRDLAEANEDYELVFEKEERLERVKWDEISVPASKYKLKTWGTNWMRLGPMQRAQQILGLVDRKALPPSTVLNVLSEDLDFRRLVGDRDVLERNARKRVMDVSKAPELTEDLLPDPYLDLATLKREGIKLKNHYELNDESQDKIDRLVNFLEEVDRLLAPPPMMQQPPPGAGAPPDGGAPPQLPGPGADGVQPPAEAPPAIQ